MTTTDETTPATLIGQVSHIRDMADGSWRLYVDCQPEDIPNGIERWSKQTVAMVIVDRVVVEAEKKAGKGVKKDVETVNLKCRK